MGSNNNNQLQRNHLQYEMGYTPKEFKKTLQGLFITQTSYACEELSHRYWQITVEGEPTLVDIKIEEAPPRIIALLTLPVLNVWFDFKESNEEQQADFIKTFFKYFHKGGG
ncbi:MAG: hypothetical protein L3J51_11385 [Cocleimonas sp.]|nr:hypothetical protein [Cocleimonas sp.]